MFTDSHGKKLNKNMQNSKASKVLISFDGKF